VAAPVANASAIAVSPVVVHAVQAAASDVTTAGVEPARAPAAVAVHPAWEVSAAAVAAEVEALAAAVVAVVAAAAVVVAVAAVAEGGKER